MSPGVACEGCVFWTPDDRPKPASYGFPSDGRQKSGQCRRYPPTLMRADQGLRAMWPLTAAWHWCGEHATKEAA